MAPVQYTAELCLDLLEYFRREYAEGADGRFRPRYGSQLDARPEKFIGFVENNPCGIGIEAEVPLDLWRKSARPARETVRRRRA